MPSIMPCHIILMRQKMVLGASKLLHASQGMRVLHVCARLMLAVHCNPGLAGMQHASNMLKEIYCQKL